MTLPATNSLAQAHAYTRANSQGRLYRPSWTVLSLLAGTFSLRLIIGLENLPDDGPLLIASNHVSSWDHCLLVSALDRPLTIMAKSELFHFPLSRLRSSIGAFPVRRGMGDEDALVTARTVLGGGGVVLIYPEGSRSKTGPASSHPKLGVGKLALETGAPVAPAAIYWRPRAGIRRREVSVIFGQPNTYGKTDATTVGSAKAISDDVYQEILGLYRQATRLNSDE